MAQARLAALALRAQFPEHDFPLTPLKTHGDRAPQLPLTEAAQEGIFVKEIEQALLDGRAELAVHSAKDLPTNETPGLIIAAFLPRADPRDVLIGRGPLTLASLPVKARVGTGSPRRAAQLLAQRPDLTVVPIRGNVDTRLRRVEDGEVDAVVLAGAGLQRLGRMDPGFEWLPLEVMLPAPGQGALAIQARPGTPAAAVAAVVDDVPTRRAVGAERAVLRGLCGGCLSAIAVHARVDQLDLVISAVVLADGSTQVARTTARGRHDATVVADIVSRLNEQGAARALQARRPERPLGGLRAMVTRPLEQAGAFVRALQDAGASVVICPVIAIEPIAVPSDVVANLSAYDWVLFTSVNGVERFFAILDGARPPARLKVGAIGPETAERVRTFGLAADVVPDRYVAEDLADQFPASLIRGKRILLPRAAGARDVLPAGLRARGAIVDVVEVYRAVPPPNLPARLRHHLRSGVDVVTFTSSSTVRHFMDALGSDALPAATRVACIGPITAATARERGLRVAIIAEEYTARGLRDALVRDRMTTRP
jgi:hydroxymethylbilane synthase